MEKVMFVCHGNICRSPMAEFIFYDLLKKEGIENKFSVCSRATSAEETGNPVHRKIREKLDSLNISTKGKYSQMLTKQEFDEYDYVIAMDSHNVRNIEDIIGFSSDKIFRLLDFSTGGDIKDPWYTGNFEEAYQDILKGCKGLLKFLTT